MDGTRSRLKGAASPPPLPPPNGIGADDVIVTLPEGPLLEMAAPTLPRSHLSLSCVFLSFIGVCAMLLITFTVCMSPWLTGYFFGRLT